MPQALPFYLVGQATCVCLALGVLVYVLSVYLLPPLMQLCVTRLYVTKLLIPLIPLTPPSPYSELHEWVFLGQ